MYIINKKTPRYLTNLINNESCVQTGMDKRWEEVKQTWQKIVTENDNIKYQVGIMTTSRSKVR